MRDMKRAFLVFNQQPWSMRESESTLSLNYIVGDAGLVRPAFRLDSPEWGMATHASSMMEALARLG